MSPRLRLLSSEERQKPDSDKPLAIQITEAGSTVLRLQELLQKILPVLEQPESVSLCCRHHLVQAVRLELQDEKEDAPLLAMPINTPEDYEPGCRVETEPW